MNWQKIKLGFWSAVGGAIILSVVGFKWGGWVTHGTAEIIAGEAVIDRLAHICVGQFNEDAQKDQKFKEFKKLGSWERGRYVEKQGWATMPGTKKPNSEVAGGCAAALMEIDSKKAEG